MLAAAGPGPDQRRPATPALRGGGDAEDVPPGAAGGEPEDLVALLESAPAGEPESGAGAGTAHIILYTSGTTGFPKGATFSQGAHYLHAVAWALMTGQHAGDVGLLVYPLFHTGGPDCILLPHFLVGGTVVLLDGAETQAMLAAIAGHRATNVFCVPTVWRRLLGALDAAGRAAPDVSSVRRCLGSSDTLPPDLLDAILGRFDGAGRLVLAGRAKDMIVTGGEKVYPVEVERLLRALPGVADVALVGVPDPVWGESVLACVVREEGVAGGALTAAAVQAYVRPRLAGYKCPRYVEFVDRLPVTSATNKVQKGRLRERFRMLVRS